MIMRLILKAYLWLLYGHTNLEEIKDEDLS